MVSMSQARERIWKSIDAHGGATAVARSCGDQVSASMLFKFRSDTGPRLGRETVNAIASVLTDIDHETWLAAMGVESAAAVA
jgi:hypothetical protein